MRLLNRSVRLVAVAACIAIGAAGAALHVSAQGPRLLVPAVRFGLTGITRGQTARLSVANNPLPGFPPDPCRVSLSFVDGDGSVFTNRDGRPFSRTVTVQPGHSEVLDVDAGAVSAYPPDPGFGGARVNVRPVVSPLTLRGQAPGNPDCVASFEVIDNTSAATVFVNPGVEVLGIPDNHNETLVRDRE